MVQELTLSQVDGSVGVALPKEMTDPLYLAAGDRVFAVEAERGILITPYDPAARDAVDLAARAAKKYRAALRKLAE